MTFAEKLKQLREAAGLTQAGLAAASGMSLGVVRDYEQGKKEPSLRSAVKIAAAIRTGVEVFVESFANDPVVPKGKARGRKGKGG